MVSVFAISSCGTPELEGEWNIVSIDGNTVTAKETAPFIIFDTTEGRVHGNTSCNLMNGSFTQDGKKLSFGNMATTMMAGPDMDLERKVLDAVGRTATVKNGKEGTLLIYDADGKEVMVLQKK